MKSKRPDITEEFLAQSVHSIREQHLRRIEQCLKKLSEEDIWWRPNPASNSVGNLVLHLSGNVRQWIVSGLGGAADRRERDKEFAEQGPVPRRQLLAGLRRAVKDACAVLEGLNPAVLARPHPIQGFDVNGLQAVFHVAEHFAYHTGQIIFITKDRLGVDLDFTRLPGESRKAPLKKLPQV